MPKNTAVYALWDGGVNYAESSPEDAELFVSIQQAADALLFRATLGHRFPQLFRYVHKPQESTLTPNADEGARMRLYYSDPHDSIDPTMFMVLEIGPRGGIRRIRTA